MCSKLTGHQNDAIGFEHISHLVPVFLLSILSRLMPVKILFSRIGLFQELFAGSLKGFL